jgi:hypothetical protein
VFGILVMATADIPLTLDEWLVEIGGITEQGRGKLEKATIVSLTTVRHLTESDIHEIKLGIGDRAVFLAGWAALRAPKETLVTSGESPAVPIVVPVVSEEEAQLFSVSDITKFFGALGGARSKHGGLGLQHAKQSLDGRAEALAAASVLSAGGRKTVPGRLGPDVTPRVLAKDNLLNRLAASYVNAGLEETLSLQDLKIAEQGEKLLLPINFCTVLSGIVKEEEEILGCGQFAGKLVWQSGKGSGRKPSPDKLSYGQFFEANARILKLLDLDTQTELDYLDYLRQIGILLQTFTPASVFCLDHLHRTYIFETGSRWCVIENTLENSVLKRKEDGRGVAVQGRRGDASHHSVPARSADHKQTGPKVIPAGATCWLYNLFKGCHWGDTCIYPHVCSVDGCRGNHPAYKHGDATNERPPRFNPKPSA